LNRSSPHCAKGSMRFPDRNHWWERIAGTFEEDPIYQKAMRCGRRYHRRVDAAASGRTLTSLNQTTSPGS
jgi:hypothetical protein